MCKAKRCWWGLVAVLLLAWTGQAEAWWNAEWQYRKKVDLDTSASGASIAAAVDGVPLLVRLHSGNFDFTRAREDGADLRFVDGDDVTPLKYQIESYDSLEELAIIWVKVPRVAAGAANSLYIYYGNAGAANGSDGAGAFDSGQSLVLHFAETEGMPADSTGFHNHAAAFAGSQGLPAIIGKGISLNGAGDMLTVPASPSLETNQGFTFSAWVRLTRPQSGAPLLTRKDKAGMLQVRIEGTALVVEFVSGEARKFSSYPVGELVLDQWNHVAVSGVAGGELHVLVNGAPVATTTTTLPNELPRLASDLQIGGATAGGAFSGELDEVRFSATALSPDHLTLSARSQAPNAAVTMFGAAETGEGGESMDLVYLATIVSNITIDGWVIISILLLVAVWSWAVVIGKSYSFYTMEKGNRIFRETFDSTLRQDPNVGCEEKKFECSPLYRIYRAGFDILTRVDEHGCGRQSGHKFHVDCMKHFMLAIEKAYMHELKQLNSRVASLTVAISGGPFLGLLGTVWGVMNTFAAMAVAGEANIMGIAPGIASALAATVMGLLVAIPALFAYNFLNIKIKMITTDLNIFLDEYAARVELHKGEA
jgi:biopolymer transport protein ExbB